MRKWITGISYVVLLLVFSHYVFAQENLISNGGFEEKDKNWGFHPDEQALGAVAIDDAEFHSGKYSLRIEHSSSERYSTVNQVIDVEPDTDYTASFWLKAEDVVLGKGSQGARLFLGKGKTGNTLEASDVFKGSFSWKKATFTFNSKSEQQVNVILYLHLGQGKVWFDDIEITKGKKVQEEEIIGEKSREDNIAFQKPYIFSPAPSYPYCTDTADNTQLTDGIYSVGYFWVQKTTVGWSGAKEGATVTIDLGKVEPIKGISFNTAAGQAGVSWPLAIRISVSEDGTKFFPIGDLAQLTEGTLPEPYNYQTFRYRNEELKTKGRYVRLSVLSPGMFIFCDEIEVYRGNDSFLNLAYSEKPVTTTEPLSEKSQFTKNGCSRRFRVDLEKVKSLIPTSRLNSNDKEKALQEVENIAEQIKKSDYPGEPEKFKAIVPYNDLHREIFRLYARLLSSQGLPPLSIWHKHRYAPLGLFEEPTGGLSLLKVTMMLNEYRSETFNLTNASQEDIKVGLQVRGLPEGINPGYIQVYQVEYVDTREGQVVASALTELKKEDDFYIAVLPSGMTRQVWLSFHPEEVKAGDYKGSVFVKSDTLNEEIPLQLSIASISFPERPDFSFGLWDYVNTYHYGMTPQNREAGIRDMKAHFVDTPWSASDGIPWPKAGDFDAEGNLVSAPDFSNLDAWVKMWPDARYYMLFAAISPNSSFLGKGRGSEIFTKMVSQWAIAWAKHNREIGLKPGQVGVLLVDEPGEEEMYNDTLDWARAIKSGTSEIFVFTDPCDPTPWEKKSAEEALNYSDIICPLLSRYYMGGEEGEKFYSKFQQGGKSLWFYSCSGPTRHFDPQSYYRLQPWHCFLHNAVGSHFWSYGDSGGTSSWNEYPA